MGATTGIEWTDATWNPIRGCSRVSEGCRNCYAERVAARFSGPGQPYEGLAKIGVRTGHHPKWTGVVRMVAEHLADPLRWRKPRRVFVNSMSDLFHDKLTNEQIAAVFGVMAAAPRHTFQVLTKRATRMREWFEWASTAAPPFAGLPSYDDHDRHRQVVCRHAWDHLHPSDDVLEFQRGPWPLPNVWLGVSVENQAAADERIPELLATPAAVRFLSCEPLLGPVRLDDGQHGWLSCTSKAEGPSEASCCEAFDVNGWHYHGVDWVIAGCESGPGARPAEVGWYRSLRDQCAAAGVPFFLKQAVGDALGVCDQGCGRRVDAYVHGPTTASYSCGCTVEGGEDGSPPDIGAGEGSHRKPGGVIGAPYLDGVQHLAFPEAARAG